jgi:catecholate siderophore receptor
MPTVLALACLFLGPALSAAADPLRHAVRGHVFDTRGAPIEGARIAAAPEDGGPAATTATDGRGEFALPLGPGRYTISAAAEGFEVARRIVTAGSDGLGAIDLVLQIAGLQESVTVSAAPADLRPAIVSATRTLTPLRDVPQSVTIVPQQLMKDQMMMSVADVVRYVPGVTAHQGENNRDQLIIRGNSTSADFFVNGVRDDVQYYRDLYNLERIEALKGPNAMIFGRGGAGGVVNRVTKDAGFSPSRQLSLQGGMFGNRRATADIGEAFGARTAARLNAMIEDSQSFRDAVSLRRYGVTPTMTLVPDARTRVTLRYEYLHDARVADRGIPSFRGAPVDVPASAYFGDPSASRVGADVHLAAAGVERQFGVFTLRNQTLGAHYDRAYQNFVPGAVTADGRSVSLSAYNNATGRTNLFNQTDLTAVTTTGRLRHTLLVGGELGQQSTDNFRNTGYFNGASTAIVVPLRAATISAPIVFRQSATDADNHLRARVAAVYGQDQIELSSHVQVVAGLRFDRFDLQYHNNRNGDTLRRPDHLVSPRAGLVYKPVAPVSVYGSYSVSYLPSSGDQFSSLTAVTEQVKPEKFNNYEAGVKWDLGAGLSLTTAVYRLDRTNTRATDPNDPTRIVQTGSQRTNGYELGVNGRIAPGWKIAGGYAWQDAFVTSATAAAAAGAHVAQVPRHTFSLWNSYQFHPRVGAGAGLSYRSDMFAAIDNSVALPGYVRADAAAYVTVSRLLRVQANVENLFDRKYYANADSNTNISPGSPRAARVGLTMTF